MIQTQLFLVLALNSLACLGIHCLTSEGMVFEQLRLRIAILIERICWRLIPKSSYYIHKYEAANKVIDTTEFILKPLFDCMPCMASIWGIIGWFYFQPDIHLIPYLLILCGVNTLVSKVYYYGD